MSFFVTKDKVPVSDDQGNTIWIIPKMGIATEARVSADFIEYGGKAINAYQLCLLRHNIVRWEGPDFTDVDEKGNPKPVPCSHANIDRLDSSIPLITAVLDKIGELNLKKTVKVTAEEENADPTPAVADT